MGARRGQTADVGGRPEGGQPGGSATSTVTRAISRNEAAPEYQTCVERNNEHSSPAREWDLIALRSPYQRTGAPAAKYRPVGPSGVSRPAAR